MTEEEIRELFVVSPLSAVRALQADLAAARGKTDIVKADLIIERRAVKDANRGLEKMTQSYITAKGEMGKARADLEELEDERKNRIAAMEASIKTLTDSVARNSDATYAMIPWEVWVEFAEGQL